MQKKAKMNETNYIIGLDLGQRVAMLSYLDHKTLKPILYDLSGGYGETAVPLLLQYLIAEKDFLIGSDAKLNQYQEGAITVDLMASLCSKQPLQIEGLSYQPSKLLRIFMEKILESFKQLNPNAVIEAITIAVEDVSFIQLKEVVLQAVEPFTTIKVQVIRASQGILRYLLANQVPIEEKTYMMDFGYSGVARLVVEKKDNQYFVSIEDEDQNIAIQKIENAFRDEIETLYKKHQKLSVLTDLEIKNLEQLFDQSKLIIFQKFAKELGLKLYYNFAFPPFQKVLSHKRMQELLEPFIEAFKMNLSRIKDTDVPIVMVGQGFKMLWPQQLLKKTLRGIEANAYEVISKGCCLIAAGTYLNLEEFGVSVKQKDVKKYGIMLRGTDPETVLLLEEQEQVIFVDFEDEKELSLCLISLDEHHNILVELEKQIKKIGAMDDQVRLCVKLEIAQDETLDLNIEYLPI